MSAPHSLPRHSRQARQNLRDFVRRCREELFPTRNESGSDWDASVWPGVLWVKVHVGKRRTFAADDWLHGEYIDFAKAYHLWRATERPSKARFYLQALRCIESALLTHTGSIEGVTWAVLDEAAVVAGQHFSGGVQYHVGREIRAIASFVSTRRLIPGEVSTWTSPFLRPSSAQRTGRAAREAANAKLPSEDALRAMAEIFSNDPEEPQVRFVGAVWALLLCAPWRISEVLSLHADAEYESVDDDGVVSYGFRYYGRKGFRHDIKWVPKQMEPVAREAFRRLREMSESSRALARHLETTPETPFLYPDAPRARFDEELTREQKGRYLRRPFPKGALRNFPTWNFRSIEEHWERARMQVPKGFPVFSRATGLRYSDALLCLHRSLLHETRPTDWYGLVAPDANTVNILLGSSAIKVGVLEKLRYFEDDGRVIRLHTHQARHYVSTLAERGGMGWEVLAKWAGRALIRDNRTYNHMSEVERVERARSAFEGTAMTVSSAPTRWLPTTPQEFNSGVRGPVQRTEFGACEHDWVLAPCMKNRDCLMCSEHTYTKGDTEAHARIRDRRDHHLAECTKALDAVLSGTNVADRWLEHALMSLARQDQLLSLLGSDDVEDGAVIRLSDTSAEHTHLSRALVQRLPKLRDPSLPESIRRMIGRYASGKPLVG